MRSLLCDSLCSQIGVGGFLGNRWQKKKSRNNQAEDSPQFAEGGPGSPSKLSILYNFEFENRIFLIRTTKIFILVNYFYLYRIIGYIRSHFCLYIDFWKWLRPKCSRSRLRPTSISKRKDSTRMSMENRRYTRSSRKKSKFEVLYAIGEPTYVRKEPGISEKFRAIVISHAEDSGYADHKYRCCSWVWGRRQEHRTYFIRFESFDTLKKRPFDCFLWYSCEHFRKGSDPNVDPRNFRQHCSELHTNVLPPAIAQDYCKEALSFETFTTTKYELSMRLDLRTKEEGYLDSKIDLRAYEHCTFVTRQHQPASSVWKH